MPATIVFASFTGEEAGLLGSREFVRRALAAKMHVAGALNNDMVGWMNDSRLDNTIRYSNAGIRDIEHSAALEAMNFLHPDGKEGPQAFREKRAPAREPDNSWSATMTGRMRSNSYLVVQQLMKASAITTLRRASRS